MPSFTAVGVSEPNLLHNPFCILYAQSLFVLSIVILSVVVLGLNDGSVPTETVPY